MASAWKIPAMRIRASSTMMTTAVAGRTTRAYTFGKRRSPRGRGAPSESEGSAVGRAGRLSDTPWVNVPSV
jgi:hypothetical protein